MCAIWRHWRQNEHALLFSYQLVRQKLDLFSKPNAFVKSVALKILKHCSRFAFSSNS